MGNWSTDFKNYPGGVRAVEVYAGPIKTTYSQVFWTSLPAVPLPPELVAEFDGKVMALVGFEADQVRRTPEGDVSVPITIAYNHHYGANLIGKGSRMEYVLRGPSPDGRTLHQSPRPGFSLVPVEHEPSAAGFPTSLPFGYSNGGEFRKTYHALVPPFAQLIESPREVHVTPMQIDTWNRDRMNLTGSPFVPGPAPKRSLAPTSGPDAVYSGLLECPLTTRLRKHITGGGWNDSVAAQLSPCAHGVATARACFSSAERIGLAGRTVSTGQGADPARPAGCSVLVNGTGAHFYFNSAASSVGAGAVKAVTGHQASLVNLSLTVDADAGSVDITMAGPAGVWFGVGFDTQYMANSPYTIVVDGAGAVSEHVLGDHTPGVVLNTSVTVVRSEVAGGIRTVTMRRTLAGPTAHYYTFSVSQLNLDFISAVGSSAAFSYHKEKSAASISLWPARAERGDPTAAGGNFGLFGAPPAGPSSGAKFRNDWEGEVGFEIVPSLPLRVTALGRSGARLEAGANVTLWDVATGSALATTTVGPAGAADGGYTYVALDVPVPLQAGRRYIVSVGCTPGMRDAWVDTDVNAAVVLPFASIGDGYFVSTLHSIPTSRSTPGRWAGIGTLKATVAPHPPLRPSGLPSVPVCTIPAAPFSHATGTLEYLPSGETIGFPPRCQLGAADYSVMKNHNPTCDLRTYVGGLSTCHHSWHLLDAEQDIPWADQPIEYWMKYRLYYQAYANHISAFDITWSIAGATGEYDVPRCASGTPVDQCKHEISGTITPPGNDLHFVAAHYHCHAPTCLSLEIWNNDTGKLLCREVPYHGGEGLAGPAKFDEPGYIAQRICLWGLHPPFEAPPLVSGQKLWVKSVTNSTYGHHGEMALPQMLLARL